MSSVATRQYNIIEIIKKAKYAGITKKELQNIPEITLDEEIEALLQKNQKLIYDPVEERYTFKFDQKYRNKEEIANAAKQSHLIIDDSIISMHENVMEYAEELRDERKILMFKLPRSKTGQYVLYGNPFEDIELQSYTIDQSVKEHYHEIQKGDHDIKNELLKHNIKLADLECAKRPNKPEKKKPKKKRKSSIKKTKKHDSFLEIAKQFQYTFFQNSPKEEEDSDDEDEEQEQEAKKKKKHYLLYHDSDANPVEWEKIRTLLYLIGSMFYDDLTIKLFGLFLEQKVYTENELHNILGIGPHQFREIMARLVKHNLLAWNTFERKGSELLNAWGIDLNSFCDAINYRLLMFRENLLNDIKRLKNEILLCPKCEKKYSAIDIYNIQHDGTNYLCIDCKSSLIHIDNSNIIKEKEEILQKSEADFKYLKEFLNELLKQNEIVQDKKDTEIKVRNPVRHSGIRKPLNMHRKRDLQNVRNSLPVSQNLSMEIETDTDNEKVESYGPFNPCPLKFRKNEILLPVIEDYNVWKNEKGFQLAKDLLDNIAEFTKMRDKHFVYVITRSTLFIAYKRNFRGPEMVRLLTALSETNSIPFSLFKLIMDEEKYSNYYKAVFVLRDGKYYIQSDKLSIIKELVRYPDILQYASSSDILKITTKSDETKEVVSEYYAIEVSSRPQSLELIKRASYNHNIPIIDEYDFSSKASTPQRINIRLKDAKIRDYQSVSSSKLFWDAFKCHSGVLVLPCGAGKTLIGINIVSILKRPAIIFCQSGLAVLQWKEQLVRWTSLSDRDVSPFSSQYSSSWNKDAPIIITTYAMFSAGNSNVKRTAASKNMINHIQNREWGIMILDEVHQAPAHVFRKVTNGFKTHIKLGLTATLVREDEKVVDLPYLVGPKLYELDIFTLKMRGHVAPVECHEILCGVTKTFKEHYDESSQNKDRRRLLYITNVNKTRVCAYLIEKHANSKIIIFCDDIFGLTWYHHLLDKPMIHGKIPILERKKILKKFNTTNTTNCILLSKVGDQSIDLPEADVVIQIGIIAGSRMQEGQRIGRVQRPHPNKKVAHFYSLISDETEEVRYAKKRRQYLIDQGYNVTVHKDISEFCDDSTLKFYQNESMLIEKIDEELRNKDQTRDDKAKGFISGRVLLREQKTQEEKKAFKKRRTGTDDILKDLRRVKKKKVIEPNIE